MFKYKIKVSDGRRAWMKSPEVLQNCSIGFHFPSQLEEPVQARPLPQKVSGFTTENSLESRVNALVAMLPKGPLPPSGPSPGIN
ncbi:hypothetical protein GH714_043571 [Hevea brasiliensis]|uniref:Uncharacterized protein n=1 Tax=Hevea brasiliensis TaxID=3981 RepID=A0A6A6K3W7_HEVBR|nr:hypothetical protein GH714_043571 [Hevea brasiliensis]